mgnify:CR=1 FL=1
MLVSSKIDQIIESLMALKPILSEDNNQNLKKFNEILSNSIEKVSFADKQAPDMKSIAKSNFTNQIETEPSGIPSWVDKNFPYDPNNPRNPTTREFSAALAGIRPEETYDIGLISDETYNKTQDTSREIMFGVIGNNKDTRDWQKIMSSPDVLEAARSETNKMYGPMVKIISEENSAGDVHDQFLALEDRNGKRLISLTHTAPIVQEKLLNFGANSKSIPDNINNLAAGGKLDLATLEMLSNFASVPELSFQEKIFESTTDAISKKIDQGIPLDDLAKL